MTAEAVAVGKTSSVSFRLQRMRNDGASQRWWFAVFALTQARFLSTETSPDVSIINLTPESKETTLTESALGNSYSRGCVLIPRGSLEALDVNLISACWCCSYNIIIHVAPGQLLQRLSQQVVQVVAHRAGLSLRRLCFMWDPFLHC